MRPRTAGIFLAAFAVLAVCIVTAGAIAAEGALHPARSPIPEVCPCIARMACREVTVTMPDSTGLRAWFYTPEHPAPEHAGSAIILLHGVGASRTDMVSLGYLFLKAGYSVLEPDLRGHGSSGGFTTYGVLEEHDIHEWADWLFAQPGIVKIYGFGSSLGGSVLLESLRAETRFRAVIAESAYSDFPSIAGERLRRPLPPVLKWLAAPILDSGLAWVRLRYSVDLSNASAAKAVSQTSVPVFLIHGLNDQRTDAQNSIRIYRANPAAVTLWLVPGGGHADIRSRTGKEFESRVLTWLDTK